MESTLSVDIQGQYFWLGGRDDLHKFRFLYHVAQLSFRSGSCGVMMIFSEGVKLQCDTEVQYPPATAGYSRFWTSEDENCGRLSRAPSQVGTEKSTPDTFWIKISPTSPQITLPRIVTAHQNDTIISSWPSHLFIFFPTIFAPIRGMFPLSRQPCMLMHTSDSKY